jgi:hypothetical protein
MYLCYFDEIKIDPRNSKNNFFIGGICIDSSDAQKIENEINIIALNFFGSSVLRKDTELHGSHIMHGHGACKGRDIEDRITLLKVFVDILSKPDLKLFSTRIDVTAHRKQYTHPMPEYNFGLMLHVENVNSYLKSIKQIGMLFGDFERDNTENSIVSLSEFKISGTQFIKHDITQLVDTLYFAHSHHSRFIQLADIFLYFDHLCYYDDRTRYPQRTILEYIDQSKMREKIFRKDSWRNKARSD